MPALAIAVSSATYLTALGYPVDIAGIVLILLGSMFVVLGNYFPKCRQNSTIGIKVPWTLGDEETWQRTHRFAGPVWVAAGLILCANAVVSLRSPVALLIVIGFAVVVPIAYPAWFYHYVREL